jgi:hypothetical protein
MIQSLAEAKAALDKEPKALEAQDTIEGDDTVAGDTPAGDDTIKADDAPAGDDTVTGDDSLAAEAEPSDDWTKGDDEPAPEAGNLSNSQAAAIRKKYQAPLKEAKDELAKTREELAAIKKQLETVAPIAPLKGKPLREQYKSDAEFQEAIARHAVADAQAQADAATRAQQAKAQRDATLNKITTSTDAHYTRAAALAAKSNISPEAYKSADLAVRQAFDAVMPGNGDALTDGMIHIIGPGSERVFYKLGVDRAKRDKAVSLLADDPSGMMLTAYLAKLSAELTAPAKRETKAPDPAPKIQGDKSNTSGATKQKRDYDEAMAKGNVQKAWSIKQAAKSAKVDTKSW